MRHRIPVETLGPAGRHMARAVETCVHCGFCLPACPTYKVLGEEMDSPRGRIVLMKQALEGEITIPDALPYVDRCLGCLACVTACPSGVQYGELLVPFRGRAEPAARGPAERLRRRTLLATLESPLLFRLAVRAGRLVKPMARFLAGSPRAMLDLVPTTSPPAQPLPEVMPARGERRARVALLAGCAQQVLAPEINHATLRVLSANGVEVVVPREQACCGALAMHAGEEERARARATALIRTMPRDVDAIVSNAAGCGSAMREYRLLLAGTPAEAEAESFSSRVRDVSELLDEIGLVDSTILPAAVTVAYHDACHLAHAQRVRTAPRRLLGRIDGLTVKEIPDGEICCGSAGIYNLEHPDVAARLGAAKAEAIVATGAGAVVSGNVGCLVQIAAHLERAGHRLPVLHTMQVLDGQPGI